MKLRKLLFALTFAISGALVVGAFAQEKKDEKKAEPAKPAAPAKPADKPAAPAKPADKAAAPAADPMMEAMMKAAAPGEFHAKLKGMEGTWDAVMKDFMSGAPTESKGVCTRKWIMDGRYIQEEYSSDYMGMPFKGLGIFGYDNATKQYVSTWLDNMSTGIMRSTGSVDATGKVFTYQGESANPMNGETMKMKMVLKIIDDKKHIFEMSGPGPDGKDMKMMEITYTKK